MTASEAKKLAEKARGDNFSDYLDQIKVAANKGETCIFVQRHLPVSHMSKLAELGYIVTDLTDFRDNLTCIKISWE